MIRTIPGCVLQMESICAKVRQSLKFPAMECVQIGWHSPGVNYAVATNGRQLMHFEFNADKINGFQEFDDPILLHGESLRALKSALSRGKKKASEALRQKLFADESELRIEKLADEESVEIQFRNGNDQYVSCYSITQRPLCFPQSAKKHLPEFKHFLSAEPKAIDQVYSFDPEIIGKMFGVMAEFRADEFGFDVETILGGSTWRLRHRTKFGKNTILIVPLTTTRQPVEETA